MLAEFVSKILSLNAPNVQTFGGLSYVDKGMHLVTPPEPPAVECSTLQGLVDLFDNGLDKITADKVLFHVTSPCSVEIMAGEADDYGRRRVWAETKYQKCKEFAFGQWMDPESFIIACQQSFQRVKIENEDGSFAKDLDYVLKIASGISAEQVQSNDDDGLAQRVAVKRGITLKEETILRPMVNLAPYRTFAEIDQVISQFVFRARIGTGSINLALFEGDGGRWKLGAVANIKAWLEPKLANVPVIS